MSVGETAQAVGSATNWAPRGLLSDARLVRLARDGDQRAFEAIFERYHQELYRYCRAVLRDPDEAQDALQGTMASALRSLPGDEREISLRPWLYRVAHNEAISILRQRVRAVDSDRLPERTAPPADSEAEARERLRHLVADLDQLPERQRGALVMRELSGLSYGEIGAALGASSAAARQTVYEARLALRELDRGREMECEAARRALSERDGRVLRSRRLRAHLRACEACKGFQAAISQRRSDLRALCPPLPAVAASSLLTALLGETGKGGIGAASGALAGGGSAGLAGGTAIAGPIAVKGASVAVAVMIAAGAAGLSGVVRLPLVGDREAPATPSHAPAAAPAAADPGGDVEPARSAGHERGSAPSSFARGRGGSAQSLDGKGRGRASGRGGPASGGDRGATGASASPGQAPAGAASDALPATSNGSPPPHSSAGWGPHSNGNAAASGTSHGKPGSPPGLSNAAANAPTLPAQAQGKPGSPPGRSGSPPAHGSSAAHGASSAHGLPNNSAKPAG
jgi:RNA polymerase sigma factor (sigma-70 family)